MCPQGPRPTSSRRSRPQWPALRQFTTEELNRQAGQLDEVLTTLRREDNAPVHWPALTAEQARAQWPILAQWIAEVLVPWYEITRDELPDCWPLHRPALLELSWLRSAHAQAYLRSSAPSVAGEWHLRWRPAVIERLSKVIDRHLCRPGEHLVTEDQSQRQTPPPPPVRPGEPVRRPVPAGRQLALPEHWNANYTAAVEADQA
jgi:hypothetical protein